jgi:hypothetical protein
MPDVSLIVEGTYPYRTGGVSIWLDRLLRGLPDVTFAVTHLGGADSLPGREVFDRPPNLVAVRDLILDPERERPAADDHGHLPDARVQHALSTGAASSLAAQAARAGRGRFLLTEHGLTWREAALGIEAYKGGGGGGNPGQGNQPGGDNPGQGNQPGGGNPGKGNQASGANVDSQNHLGGQRRAALHADREPLVARRLAQEAYDAADIVTTVCAENSRLQIALGADATRTHVIPNGVQSTPMWERPGTGDLWIGLVGRVVGVKDIGTFLRACAIVARQRSDVRFAVVGPLDHEPAYAQRCIALARRLGLESRLVFTGETDPAPWYRRLDMLCLTSVSEAQPLVVLEAMAAGLPVVCTAVGGCAQLVGAGGIVTAPGTPRATADALLRLCGDRELRARLGAAGRARSRHRHDANAVHATYHRLYETLAG